MYISKTAEQDVKTVKVSGNIEYQWEPNVECRRGEKLHGLMQNENKFMCRGLFSDLNKLRQGKTDPRPETKEWRVCEDWICSWMFELKMEENMKEVIFVPDVEIIGKIEYVNLTQLSSEWE